MRTESRGGFPRLCMAVLLAFLEVGCERRPAEPAAPPTPGPSLPTSADVLLALRDAEAVRPARPMQGSGLAGARGGVRLRAQRAGTYDMALPLPQSGDGQIPVFYLLEATPKEALAQSRVSVREDGNACVHVQLAAKKRQEIALEWSAVVLVAAVSPPAPGPDPASFLAASPCAQAEDPRIAELAGRLWPASGAIPEFAAAIQDFIGRMTPVIRPLSLDASSILASGHNTICTANANLACALLRARRIPCRSMAALPTISHRFEMHRIAAFHDGDAWVPFDPSRVHADIPLKPWQNLVMARTSIADEQAAGKPRLGAMLGSPLGQEAEFARPGLSLFGQDFFWAVAMPLAEFEVAETALRRTRHLWDRYLETGDLVPAQVAAAVARTSGQYLDAIGR